MTFTPNKYCLDRACEFQSIHAHYEHPKDALGDDVKVALTTSALEDLKTSMGRRCHNCARYLIPTDGDHTFCDDCWDMLMVHEFSGFNVDRCEECSEPMDARIHQTENEI